MLCFCPFIGEGGGVRWWEGKFNDSATEPVALGTRVIPEAVMTKSMALGSTVETIYTGWDGPRAPHLRETLEGCKYLLSHFSAVTCHIPNESVNYDNHIRSEVLGEILIYTKALHGLCLCLVAQSCPTLCDPMDCSPPGSSVHGDSQGKNTGVGCHALF